jgi:hypothetical protein
MKYLKHMLYGSVGSYQPEGTNMYIPHNPANSDYARMMEEVEAGTSTIEEIDDTPE